jgi:hypothetical protein
VNEPDAQVDYDDNGEPIPEAQNQPLQKKTEDDVVVKKALEILGVKG